MLFPQKTLQQSNKPTTLPILKFPLVIQYSRNFHKNKSTTQFKSHFKVFHSNKNSHRGESLSHNTSIDVIEQIRAYALKLQVSPTTDKATDCTASKEAAKVSQVRKLQIHFNSHRSSSELKGKKKECDDKQWHQKFDNKVEFILPTIKEVKPSKI